MDFLIFMIIFIVGAKLINLFMASSQPYKPSRPCTMHKWEYLEDNSGMKCHICGKVPSYEGRD